jgi:HlyD family secretion protein
LYTITAEMDGLVNVIVELNTEDAITPNTPIATILPDGESEFRVLLLIESRDIAGIETESLVKYEIPAHPSQFPPCIFPLLY